MENKVQPIWRVTCKWADLSLVEPTFARSTPGAGQLLVTLLFKFSHTEAPAVTDDSHYIVCLKHH